MLPPDAKLKRARALLATGLIGAVLVFLPPAGALSSADLGFTTAVSERLMQAYSRRFGPAARNHLEDWKRLARERKLTPLHELELLGAVNLYINRLRFVEDIEHWGQIDFWATPAESVASGGADCEDFSIAKYFLLKELGVPITRLRLTYVKAVKLNQAHMVLAYYARPDAEPLVLDNLEETVRPASQRADLVPVYSFNDEEVWVDGRGGVGSPGQLRNWGALIKRLEYEART